jgi:general secretion pathway protein D
MRKQLMNTSIRLSIAALASSLALAVFPPTANAGDGPPTGIADQEVIKRLERIQKGLEAEAEGDKMMRNDDYEGAIAKYNEALVLIPNAPLGYDDRQRIIAKYANACCKQADKLGKDGQFDEAKRLLNTVLADDRDPEHHTAKTLLKRLDDPDYYNPAQTKKHAQDTEEVRRLLKLALGYMDLGQFNEAEESLNKILAIDPHNAAARRLMEKKEREVINYLRSARDHTRSRMLREVDQLWETAVPAIVTIPVTPGGVGKGKATGAIMAKLNNITLDRLSFDGAQIQEVVAYLKAKSVELDTFESPATGVNFILQGAEKAQPITLDIRNVPLLVALEQVCQLSGMVFRVEPHAVFITSADKGGGALETRIFNVPPNFMSAGAAAGGAAGGAEAAADPFASGDAGAAKPALPSRGDAKQVLVGMGANFEAPGSTATFLAGTSKLVVKNTLQQLDLIEQLIEKSTVGVTKQVHITTRFVEVSQRNTDELGFDTLIGAFNVGSNRVFGSGGTTSNAGNLRPSDYPFLIPTSGANPVPVGQNPVTSALRSGTRAINQNAIDGLLARQLLTSDISALAPGAFALAGVFTDPQFQIVMRALSQKKGVDLLTAPSIVTRSGQRAKIEIIREFPYPTDFDPPQIPQTVGTGGITGGGLGGIGGGAGGGLSSVGGVPPVTPTTPVTFEVRNTGVTMEVDPVIADDGSSIDLNLAPEVVEFEGFINYGSPINTAAINALGVPTQVVLTENRIEQPVFATRKLTTAVTVWDGQTVGIGGLIREDVQQVEDKVPFFGDIPLLGRLFRTESEEHFKKNLMVYVTAKLIDPAGRPWKQAAQGSGGSESEGASSPLIPTSTGAPGT